MNMRRLSEQLVVSFVANTCETPAVDVRLFAMGQMHLPATWTAASVGFKVCPTEGGTFQPLYSETGVLVQCASVTVSRTYVFPSEVAVSRWIKLWSQNAVGVNVDQAAARSIWLDLKA